jgi:hypothetical protein
MIFLNNRLRQILLTIYLFLLLLSIHGQEKQSVTIDLGLSQTYKGFFYLFNGVVEFGAGYNHRLIDHLYVGGSFHIDYLSRSNSSARTIVYKPKVNINYNAKVSSWLSINPIVFVGYSFVNISNGEFDYAETQNGVTTGAELKFIWFTPSTVDYYLFGRFDYIILDKDENFTLLNYYRRVYLTSFGIGIKIKPKERKFDPKIYD